MTIYKITISTYEYNNESIEEERYFQCFSEAKRFVESKAEEYCAELEETNIPSNWLYEFDTESLRGVCGHMEAIEVG